MDEFEFSRLIKRYEQGLLSGDEKALLDQWFEALANKKDTIPWTEAEKIQLKDKIREHISTGRESVFADSVDKTFISGRRFLRTTFRVAAAILVLISVSFAIQQWSEASESAEVASLKVSGVDKVRKVVLADGSIVWLKDTSTLTYPKRFTGNERYVTLVGEALFEVARDSLQPFVIQCGALTTTVLGTSFNIKASKESIEVVVLTGKVSLSSENDKEGMIVMPNEKALYRVAQKQIAKVPSAVNDEERTETVEGTQYLMDFEDTKMSEVIRRIEEKFDLRIKTEDPDLANCIITGAFTGQSLERTLSMIAQTLRFDYEISEDVVMVYGGGCD